MKPSEVEEILSDPNAPNAPARMKGGGLTGPRQYVDAQTARERRAAMSAAFMRGASRDAIMQTFTEKFGMSEHQIVKLMHEVREMWAQEDVEAAKIARPAARRRILRHIDKAASAGKWTAVSNLEKVLSEVEGTSADSVNAGDSDNQARMMEAVMNAIGTTDPAQLRIIIERERTLIETRRDEMPATERKMLDASVSSE